MADSSDQALIEAVVAEYLEKAEAQAERHVRDLSQQCQSTLEDFCKTELVTTSEICQQLAGLTKAYEELSQQNAALRNVVAAAMWHIQRQPWMGNPMQMASPVWTGAPVPAMPSLGSVPQAETRTEQLPGPPPPGLTRCAASEQHHSRAGSASSAPPGLRRASSPYSSPGPPGLPVLEERPDEDTDDSDTFSASSGLPTPERGPCSRARASPDRGHKDSGPPATPPRGVHASPGHLSRHTPGSASRYYGTPSTRTPTTPGSPIPLTLRRVDPGEPLGLEVSPDAGCLRVEAIQPGTVVDAWNKQCVGEPRAILPGDRVISVNGVTEPDEMRKECSQRLLLKLEKVRDADL